MASILIRSVTLAALSILAGNVTTVAAQGSTGGVYVLRIDGAIGPATGDYIEDGVAEAVAADAALIVIEMDTPGGLDTSMRQIIQAILVSPVPVATYVSPEGARAASAGTYILYASHIAAMAPATNLGAATPVSIGGEAPAAPAGSNDPEANDDSPADGAPAAATTSERKAINDAVAYIRSLAERRGRNADWAESAVRSSASLSAEAARAAGVIDLIARDRADLLRQIDGRSIDGNRLSLPAGLPVTEIEPDWRNRLLAVIGNPTVAYMLMLIGIYGLVFEGYNPGAVVPGVVGGIALLLALFAFQILPVNYAGLALLALGLVLMIAEFFVPSFGTLGLGGIAAFVFGSLMLIDTDVPGYQVATGLIAGIATGASLLLLGTIWLALQARRRAVVSGVESMIGATAEALEDFADEGSVWVHGERWRARTRVPVTKGQRLKVKRVEGLLLDVESASGQIQ